MVKRWIRQCRSRRPASKVFEDAGSRAKTKGEAGINVVLLSPHPEAWIETILNADYRSTLAIMASFSNLLRGPTTLSIVE